MKPQPIGTIFATKAQLDKADRFADAQREKANADAAKSLLGCERREVGGEVRFYTAPNKYGVASRLGKILWFEIRADGHSYATK